MRIRRRSIIIAAFLSLVLCGLLGTTEVMADDSGSSGDDSLTGDNLIINAGFEDDLLNWSFSGSGTESIKV